MNIFLTILFNTLFDISLRNHAIAWLGIYLMRGRKCAPAVRYLQHKKGGKLVYAVKVKWSDNKVSDHFMNLIDGQIVDLYGNHATMLNENTIDFGNGEYRIVDIVENWKDFGINGLVDLKNKDRYIHLLILKESESL